MHNYSINSNERNKVGPWIAVFVVVLALLLYSPDGWLKLQAPWWLDAPSVMGLFGILYGFFENSGWKWRLARLLRLSTIPELAGEWNGILIPRNPTSPKLNEEITATLTIRQNWQQMLISLATQQSSSDSTMAALEITDTDHCVLRYAYRNEPKYAETDTMAIHDGTTRLTYCREGDQDVLDGEYYTGRGRESFGTLRFTRRRKP